MSSITPILAFGVIISSIVAIYVTLGLIGAFLYKPQQSNEKAENVKFVITSVASDSVRPALMESIEYTVNKFPDYELHITIDEGSDLQDELKALQEITTIVVPEDYTCNAEAKGRAIQYYIDTVVTENQDYWFAFFDDDNHILTDDILYEIPHYEPLGYRAANPVLVPRSGRSSITFIMDHLRTLDDLTVFRTFTGLLGKPYVGFHGELLTVRGDTLVEIGFDRPSIVEDYAFATQLIMENIPTWQTNSRVSILSPHTIKDLFDQRRRWYLGLMKEQLRNPWASKLFMGLRMFAWTFALFSGIAILPLWLLQSSLTIPWEVRGPIYLSSIIYFGTYTYGVNQIDGWDNKVKMFILIPIFAILESATALYSIVRYEQNFIVIEK